MLSSSATAGTPQALQQQEFALYTSDDAGKRYERADPMILEPIPGESLSFVHEYTIVALSADGSTSAMIDMVTLAGWVAVHDGVFEAERLTIDVEEVVYGLNLSADGSRLTTRSQWMSGPYGCDPITWYTWDTIGGELISATSVDLGAYVGEPMISPGGDRLYVGFYERAPRPVYPATPLPVGSRDTGQWLLRIAAFDLDTGAELGRMTVPDVMAGSWQVESIDNAYTGEYVSPGIALSPDGTTIAVVDAELATLTLIDAKTLTVSGTHDIHELASMTSRVLGWLGILPEVAEAKVASGSSVDAVFSTDGEHLYLTGEDIEVGDSVEDMTGHGFGVLRIDIATGEIADRALDGHHFSRLLPSPDNRSLYALRTSTPWWEESDGHPAFVLHRLYAATLAPLAERQLDGWTLLLLIPAGGSPS